MFERIQQLFQAVTAAFTRMAEPVAFNPARRKALGGMVASTAATAAKAGGEAELGYTAEYWKELTDALKKLRSATYAARLQMTQSPDPVKNLALSDVALFTTSPDSRLWLHKDVSDSQKIVAEFRACHEKVVELLGSREIPISALPVNPLKVGSGEVGPTVLSQSSLTHYLPKDGFDGARHKSALIHKSIDRQLDIQWRLKEVLEEKCNAAKLPSDYIHTIYDAIVERRDFKNGADFERHVQRYIEEPSLLNAAIKKEKIAQRTQQKKHHRAGRTFSGEGMALLSHIFGGLDFVQDPLSLKVYAVVDTPSKEAADAIAGINNHLKRQYNREYYSYDLRFNAKERSAPLPTEAELFVSYSKKTPFERVDASAESEVYLTLKPHQAMAIVAVFDKNFHELKNGPQSSLSDCFFELFDYGRKQAKQVGGTPLSWRERINGPNDAWIGR